MRGFNPRARAVDEQGRLMPEFWRSLTQPDANIVGSMYLSGNASATACTPTPVVVSGTTTPGDLYGFDHTNGRLTYTGSMAKTLALSVCASFTTSGGKVGVGVSVNGAATMSYATTTAGFLAAQVAVELSPGDYIEAVVSNASSNAVTVTDMQVVAR